MTTNAETERTQIQRAMPLTRILRLLTGLSLVLITVMIFRQEDPPGIARTIGVAAALVPFYALVHYLVGAYLPRLNRWLGAALAVTPVGLLFFLGPSWATVGAVVFVGVSLLLTAIVGDPGCEVMSIPGLFLRKRTHLACIAFTPLDWVEEMISRVIRS